MLLAGVVTACYTTTSGLYGVAYTDALQFGIFLIGNIILVPIVIGHAGGMDAIYQTVLTDARRVVLQPESAGAGAR